MVESSDNTINLITVLLLAVIVLTSAGGLMFGSATFLFESTGDSQESVHKVYKYENLSDKDRRIIDAVESEGSYTVSTQMLEINTEGSLVVDVSDPDFDGKIGIVDNEGELTTVTMEENYHPVSNDVLFALLIISIGGLFTMIIHTIEELNNG